MRLFGVVKSTAMLSSRLGVGGTTTGWIIEEFTAQMRAVSKIALHRRSNFAAFLDTNGIVAILIHLSFIYLFSIFFLYGCIRLETY